MLLSHIKRIQNENWHHPCLEVILLAIQKQAMVIGFCWHIDKAYMHTNFQKTTNFIILRTLEGKVYLTLHGG